MIKKHLLKSKICFLLFAWFSIFFYGIFKIFYGNIHLMRTEASIFVFISRDIIFLLLIIFLFYSYKDKLKEKQYFTKNTILFLGGYIIFFFTFSIYHLFIFNIKDVLQYEIRNLLEYSLIVFFIPLLFDKRQFYKIFIRNIICMGIVLSTIAIISRIYGIFDSYYRGRAISTFDDPNSLGIFLLFCSLILLAWPFKNNVIKIALLFLLNVAIIITGSITAFVTMLFSFFIFFIFKKKYLESIGIILAIIYLSFIVSFTFKIIDNREFSIPKSIKTFSTDKYLLDRLNMLTMGNWNLFIGFKFSNLPSKEFYTYTNRVQQFKNFKKEIYNELTDASSTEKQSINFKTTDSQYFNYFYNTNIMGLSIFCFFIFIIIVKLFKLWIKTKKDIILACFAFFVGLVLLAYNSGSFFAKYPLNFWTWVLIGIILWENDRLLINQNCNKIN